MNLFEKTEEFQSRLILAALRESRGSISGAARILEVGRTSLTHIIGRLGLNDAEAEPVVKEWALTTPTGGVVLFVGETANSQVPLTNPVSGDVFSLDPRTVAVMLKRKQFVLVPKSEVKIPEALAEYASV